MYVTKRGNKFRAWERVNQDGIVRKYSVTMDRDTPQARKKAAEALAAKIARPVSDLRYSDLVRMYIEYQQMTVKMSTWTRNKASLERLSSVFGNPRISDMTAGFISSRLLKKTKDPTTYNEYLRRLKSMLRWAFRNDLTESQNAVEKLRPIGGKTDREKAVDKFLDSDELVRLLAGFTPYYRNIFEFLALSGLRIGELIALDDADVGDEIRVTKTFDSNNGVINTPKTFAGKRSVYVQPELAACIRRIRAQSNAHRMRVNRRPPYFIIGPYGDRLSYVKSARVFRETCQEILGRKLTIHALRHTHVALMAENGIELDAIARRLGHSDSRITREIYYHVTKRQKEKDDAAFAAVRLMV